MARERTWPVKFWGGPFDGLEDASLTLDQFIVKHTPEGERHLYQRSPGKDSHGVTCYTHIADVNDESDEKEGW